MTLRSEVAIAAVPESQHRPVADGDTHFRTDISVAISTPLHQGVAFTFVTQACRFVLRL